MPDPLQFRLERHPRDRRRNGAGLLALGLLLGATTAWQIYESGGAESVIAGGLFALGLMAVGITRLIFVGGKPVSVDAKGLHASVRPTGHRVHQIEFGKIHSVLREKDLLFIATKTRTFVFDGADFVEADAIARMYAAIRVGIARESNATALQRDVDRRSEYAKRLWSLDAPVTRGLLTLIVLVFVAEVALGALASPLGLIRLGANVPPLVAAGEWHRLISANFLHAMVLHIVFNAVALVSLGGVVERLLGSPRFLSVYLLSAVAGAGASTLFSGGLLAVGASTAVFGLLGSLAALHLLDRDLPVLFRQSVAWWVFIVIANGALPVLVPFIDTAAHLGGFLGGALATALMVRIPERGTQAVAAALSAVTVLALGIALYEARTWSPDDDGRALSALATSEDPEQLNNVAWTLAIDPDSNGARLIGAEALARQAITLDEDPIGALTDTLATVLHRRGQWRNAVTFEDQTFAKRDDDFTATQLARFLNEADSTGTTVTLNSERDTIMLGEPKPNQVLYAVVRVNDKLAGLVRADPQGITATGEALPEGVTLGPAIALPRGEREAEDKWKWYPARADVLELP